MAGGTTWAEWRSSILTGCLAVLVGLGLAAVAPASAVGAQDLSVRLSDAEGRVAAARAEASEARALLGPAQRRFGVARSRAAGANEAARLARVRAEKVRTALVNRQRSAAAEVDRFEAAQARAVADHDDEVAVSWGFGLAALLIAGLVLGWGRFRDGAAIAWLQEQPRSQTISFCLFGGLALVVIGAIAGAGGGVAAALGVFLFLLGLVLPTALLFGLHSARVQKDAAKPLLGRKRFPDWATYVAAAIPTVLGLAVLGGAVFRAAPEKAPVSAELIERASARTDASANPKLATAQREVAVLRRRADRLVASRRVARGRLNEVRRQLDGSQRRLTAANRDVERIAKRIAVAIAEEEETMQTTTPSSECHPSYVGACLDPNASDYDCAGGSGDGPMYTGPVQVVGSDPYGLDADGDGYACE